MDKKLILNRLIQQLIIIYLQKILKFKKNYLIIKYTEDNLTYKN